MGQKANPKGLRLALRKKWGSRWYSKHDFAKNLNEDLDIRKFVAKKYVDSGIANIEIERAAKLVYVRIFAARPGKLIGKQGKGIDSLREELKKFVKALDRSVKVDIFEAKNPDIDASLCAQKVAQELEKRVSFRRAMKKVMAQAMKSGAQGIRVRVSGRLNGAEIARTEWYKEGRVPLHTLRADIDHAKHEALTTYGLIGVQVWVFKGEVLARNAQHLAAAA